VYFAITVGWKLRLEFAAYGYAIVIGLLLAWVISDVWTRVRLRKAVITNAGPDPSTPEERRFPSDAITIKLQEMTVPPMPMWADISVILLCQLAGLFAGSVYIKITG